MGEVWQGRWRMDEKEGGVVEQGWRERGVEGVGNENERV